MVSSTSMNVGTTTTRAMSHGLIVRRTAGTGSAAPKELAAAALTVWYQSSRSGRVSQPV